MSAVLDIQQHFVTPAAGKSSDDHDQGKRHNTMNTHTIQSGDTTEPPFERPDSQRIRVRFPPAANKQKKLDSELSHVLVNGLQKKLLKEKLDTFREIVHLLGGNERKEVTSVL